MSEINFIRHSKAKYETYKKIMKSDTPEASYDPEYQLENDLTEEGIELAREEAENFFSKINPKQDALFFASSKEMRAFETAKIYQEIARRKDFEILTSHSSKDDNRLFGTGIARKMANENIRAIDALSLDGVNSFTGSVFNPDSHLGEINWKAISSETKEKWERARVIINSDDQGSWGSNFLKHSEEIQKIFPEIRSAAGEYEKTFKNLLKLARFSQEKINNSNHPKRIKILAFGHENGMVYALNKYFKEEGINNCETLLIDVSDDGVIIGRYRGKEAKM